MSLVASDVMEPKVLTVGIEWSVQQATDLFFSNAVSGAPVLDAEGELKGIVSLTDVAQMKGMQVAQDQSAKVPAYFTGDDAIAISQIDQKSLHLAIDPQATVADIMTEKVYTVRPDTPICDIAQAMISGRIHRVLVTENDQLKGIVTTLDLLEVMCALPAGAFEGVQPPKASA